MLTELLGPSGALSPLETDDSSRGAVSRKSDAGLEAVTASQLRNKTDCQEEGPAGQEESSRHIWKANELASEGARGVLKVLHVFSDTPCRCLSLGRKVQPPPPLPLDSPPRPAPTPHHHPILVVEKCDTVWKANFHHWPHEY